MANWSHQPISKLRGQRVELLCDIQTCGGDKFERGETMVIVAKYRGLELARPDRPTMGLITRVSYDQVKLLSPMIYYAEKWRDLYWNVGSRHYVDACIHAESPVVEVSLQESPAGDYWGWIDAGREEVVMIQPHRGLFDMQFTHGPEAEVQRGHGRIVRLCITEAAQID